MAEYSYRCTQGASIREILLRNLHCFRIRRHRFQLYQLDQHGPQPTDCRKQFER